MRPSVPGEVQVLDRRQPPDQPQVLVDEMKRGLVAVLVLGEDDFRSGIGLMDAGQGIFTKVDFPDPFWPTNATISPESTPVETESRAFRPGNDFETSRT